MSLSIRLLGCISTNNEPIQDIEPVYDPHNRLYELALALGEASPCLRFIDIYGDLMLNDLQVRHQLLPELERLRALAENPDDVQLIERVRMLAKQIFDEPHRNLWILGD